MLERMSGASVEGWRLRRVPRRPHGRAPRAVVAGETPLALDVACRLSAAGASQVAQGLEGASTADALIICSDEPALVREAALWAARACPWTAIILAARRGLALSAEAARASGLPPWLILSPGGIPHAAAETARLARRLDVCASQVDVPVIGGDAPGATRVLRRYVTVAGVPLEDLEAPGPAPWRREPASPVTEAALGAAAILLALCVLGDRRRIVSCGAWVEKSFGLPGAFVTAPVPVGARGAEEPHTLHLTLEEKAFLQAAVARATG